MASGPFVFKLLSDVKDFLKGTKDASKGLEEVSDSLDGLTREAANADIGDALGDGIRDGAQDAERHLDKIGDSIRDLDDEARRADVGDTLKTGIKSGAEAAESAVQQLETKFKDAADAAKKVDDGADGFKKVKDSADRTKSAVSEMGDETLSTAREMGASFGSVEDIADATQEVLANMFVGFGPVGGALGIVAASGLGLLLSSATDSAEAVNLAKEAVGDLASAIYDAGGDISQVDIAGRIVEWGNAIKDDKQFFEVWQKGAVSNLDAVRDAADETGISLSDMFLAMSGGDADKATEVVAELKTQLDDTIEAGKELNQNDQASIAINENRVGALQKLIDEIMKQNGITDEAIESGQFYVQVTEEMRAADEAAAEATKKKADALEFLDSAYDDATGAVNEFYDEETKIFDTEAYLASIEERKTAIQDYANNIAGSGLSDQAKAYLDSLGFEQASILGQAFVNATPAQQAVMAAAWDEAGKETSLSFISGAQTNADGTPVIFPAELDTEPAQASASAFPDSDFGPLVFDSETNTKGADADADGFVDADHGTAVFETEADIKKAQRALDNLQRDAKKPITVEVDVQVNGLAAARSAINGLTRTETKYINVVERKL